MLETSHLIQVTETASNIQVVGIRREKDYLVASPTDHERGFFSGRDRDGVLKNMQRARLAGYRDYLVSGAVQVGILGKIGWDIRQGKRPTWRSLIIPTAIFLAAEWVGNQSLRYARSCGEWANQFREEYADHNIPQYRPQIAETDIARSLNDKPVVHAHLVDNSVPSKSINSVL